jgi:hypothetical protein
MVAPRSVVRAALIAGGLVAAAAWGRDEPRAAAAALGESIESCVDRSTIRFRTGDRRTLLDAIDTASVAAALVRRYPMVEQDGLVPQRIAVWRKPEVGWLYVALLANPAKPAELCFTATFTASRFELTASVLEKYFGIVPPSD